MKFNKNKIPNIITITRIVIAPLIVIILLMPPGPLVYPIVGLEDYSFSFNSLITVNFFVAGILFMIASFSDWLDGYLARKYNGISDFGKFWDPIADKILVNSILIAFIGLQITPIGLPIIMIGRDVIVDACRMDASAKGVVVPANCGGKAKTIFQYIGILIALFFLNCPYSLYDGKGVFGTLQNLALYIALFFSVFSGIIYTRDFIKNKFPVNK